MRNMIIAFRWVLASLLLALIMLGLLILTGLYVPPGTEVTSEAVSRNAAYTGRTIWVFLIGIPSLALILAIRGLVTRTRGGNDSEPN